MLITSLFSFSCNFLTRFFSSEVSEVVTVILRVNPGQGDNDVFWKSFGTEVFFHGIYNISKIVNGSVIITSVYYVRIDKVTLEWI